MADVTIQNEGSVFLFTIHTDEARRFVNEAVELEPWQWLGSTSFAVEHRFALALAEGIQLAGLEVD